MSLGKSFKESRTDLWLTEKTRIPLPGSESEITLREKQRATLDRLYQQVRGSVAPGVREAHWTCRALKYLESLYLAPSARTNGQVEDLAGLFDRLLVASEEPEFKRLATVYHQHIEPVVLRHFRGGERRRLKDAAKTLVILQVLKVPYRPGCPISQRNGDVLLSSLHRLCGGVGLMVWHDAGKPVYVVEVDHERFADWIVARMASFLGSKDRDKVVSDALWSMLFPVTECGSQPKRTLSPIWSQSHPILLSGDAFGGREALLVRRSGLGERVLVFESPWKTERGRRVHRVMQALPKGISPSQVWIWVPRHPPRREREQIACYMATARALRVALSCVSTGETNAWLIHNLRRQYVWATMPALKGIVDCYRQGVVVSDRDTWRPDGTSDSLLHLVEDLVAWASYGNGYGRGSTH